MRYVKIKIGQLRIDDEELNSQLKEKTFTLSCRLPLPDIYQKGVST